MVPSYFPFTLIYIIYIVHTHTILYSLLIINKIKESISIAIQYPKYENVTVISLFLLQRKKSGEKKGKDSTRGGVL